MTRYRLVVGQRREWPWRETYKAAVEDALDSGNAERDEHVPERVYLVVPAEIEEEVG